MEISKKIKNRKSTRGQRGFSLVELATAIGIVATLAAVGVPSFQESIRTSEVRQHGRTFFTDLQSVRGRVMTREMIETSATPPSDAPSSGLGGTSMNRTRFGGIRIQSRTSYVVFLSDGRGGEEVVRAHSIPRDMGLRITRPRVGETIRFRTNGTLTSDSPTRIVMRDLNSARRFRIDLSVLGRPTATF